MAWEGSSKPRRRRFWQWTRRFICTTPAGPTRRWATAPLKRRTAWRHESVEGRTGKRVRTGRERPVGCAASRLRSAAKRRNQPQISHIRKTADKLTNLSQDLTGGTEGERWGSGALAEGFQCAILAQNSLLVSIVNQQSLIVY